MTVRSALTAAMLSGILVSPVHARQRDTINIYRYVLGVDVPASPSFVGFGVQPGVPIGSSPKPVALSATSILRSDGSDVAVGVDIAPYYLFGGGIRTFDNYRSMSVAGRLTRVLTKTILSIGVLRAANRPGAMDLAIAVRSTFHDPHDVPTQSAVIAEVASAFDRAGRSMPPIDETHLRGWGVNLEGVFARARTAVRGRAGDVQVSGGWAMVVEARDGVIHPDSLGPSRHVGWITAQYTANRRYDLLIFTEYRNAFRSDDRVAVGFAVRRKSDRVDVQSGVTVDISHGALEPGFTVASRVTAHVGVIGAVVVRADPPVYIGPRRLNASLTAQWFYASDR